MERSRERFSEEIARNRDLLRDAAAYHETIPARIDSLVRTLPPERLVANTPLPLGLYFRTLERAAWETAVVTQALPLMPAEEVGILSAVYSRQQDFVDLRRMITASFLSPQTFEAERVRSTARFLSIMMSEVALNEAALVELYEEALRVLADGE